MELSEAIPVFLLYFHYLYAMDFLRRLNMLNQENILKQK